MINDIVAEDLSDVTLVGHSMAGLTLPGVAERIPDRLSHLAFVSCAVPPDGTPLTDVLGDLSPAVHEVAANIGDDVVDREGGLHPDLFIAMFCNDMDERQTASTLARRVPESFKVLSDPTDLTGLRHPIPRTYVRLARDASITLDSQNKMIANLGAVSIIDLGRRTHGDDQPTARVGCDPQQPLNDHAPGSRIALPAEPVRIARFGHAASSDVVLGLLTLIFGRSRMFNA